MRSMALRKWRRNALILSFSDGPPGLCAVFCLAEPFFVPARCVFCSCELPLWSFFSCDSDWLARWLPGLACSHFSVPFAHERPLCVLTRAPAGGRHPPIPRRLLEPHGLRGQCPLLPDLGGADETGGRH